MNTRLQAAADLDQSDPFAGLRRAFAIPRSGDAERIYLSGNSLGLQPLAARDILDQALDMWATEGVRGHFLGERPWAPFHELLTEPMARIVGARPEETIVMNSLTANLHFLMVSFYRPTVARHKILIEEHAFPSDLYAVESQIRFHGFDPNSSLVRLRPRSGEETLRPGDIADAIDRLEGDLALVLLPGVQYYTGQVLPMADIARQARAAGIVVGFDLAHAAGNVEVDLHDWDVDFAVWCTYKYLNGGPGATGAAFVHARHVTDRHLPRFNGWWGHDKATRFEMGDVFDPIPSAEAWQVSNAPILSMAPLVASLDIFETAGGVAALRAKSLRLTDFLLEAVAASLSDRVRTITPSDPHQRGCQLSLEVTASGVDGREVFDRLVAEGVDCDWRYPNVIRVAPVPLYNSYTDVARFVQIFERVTA